MLILGVSGKMKNLHQTNRSWRFRATCACFAGNCWCLCQNSLIIHRSGSRLLLSLPPPPSVDSSALPPQPSASRVSSRVSSRLNKWRHEEHLQQTALYLLLYSASSLFFSAISHGDVFFVVKQKLKLNFHLTEKLKWTNCWNQEVKTEQNLRLNFPSNLLKK